MSEFANNLLALRRLSKHYPGVVALNDVSLDLRAGEVHCLVGENGAGKSTLIKVMAGAERPDSGEIWVHGVRRHFAHPGEALAAGIGVIYQDFKLVPALSVAENILLGHQPRRWAGRSPFIDWKKLQTEAAGLLAQLGVALPLQQPVARLSVAQRQMVEIGKALHHRARIIAMDEPSATLSDIELDHLFVLIRRLVADGVGIIYISHRLEEIFEIGNRVTVLRDGRWVTTTEVAGTNRQQLVQWMVGRALKEENLGARQLQKDLQPRAPEVLRVENLSRAWVRDVSFSVHAGEIFGLAGLVGSGRTEVARMIFGADRRETGFIFLEGKKINPRSPAEAIALGIGLLTEDRNQQGLIMGLSVQENIVLSSYDKWSKGWRIDWRRVRETAQNYVTRLQIRTPSLAQKVANLSGGNRQKVVLARWLATNCRVLIFDEPTWGIDVGVKREIHELIHQLASEGRALIVISSDLPEVLSLADRIGVMWEGRLAGILAREEATQEKIMHLATGHAARVRSLAA
ncbi:MAG: sugar ABC transporter ATP-binding protein [candidate division KSB1 bacterium]|nr:sugar ABC transporter ATP-binding protein [candidate division KSB1 bacterium]MDZ7304109.1 sugar ABC transporter ATP-binding protein [candidate division KSB1 bacterium]MDZ7313394.1 sugar ABC transporter ATP-binding protein [candidate division KSB1 bacterium]